MSDNDVNIFSIANFLASVEVSNGLARQNKYLVIIPTAALASQSTAICQAISDGITNGDATWDWMNNYFAGDPVGESYILSAFCDHAELPGYQFQLETVRTYGPVYKYPHMPEYQDITLTFLCGGMMYEKQFFEAWMYMIMDPITNNFNYIGEYAIQMTILVYPEGPNVVDDEGNQDVTPIYQVNLIDCFPVAINAQELGYELNNSVLKLSVTFTYKSWIPTTTGKNSGNIIGKNSTVNTTGQDFATDPLNTNTSGFSAYQVNPNQYAVSIKPKSSDNIGLPDNNST